MKQSPNLYAIIALAVLLIAIASAQTPKANKHYENGVLSFDYPDEWELNDSSSQEVQTVTLTRKGSVSKIEVNVKGGPAPTCDFEAERKKIADALVEKVSAEISANAGGRGPVTTQIGGSEAEGARLKGVVNRKPVVADVYSIRLNRRFVSMIYLLADNDVRTRTAWSVLRSSLKVEPGVIAVIGALPEEQSKTPITSGVLNGRALALPHPAYPPIARSAHASGTVVVQVTIDEAGNVMTAHAVSGHPLLQAACVAAAKEARFSPTKLCDEAVRVTGVITYIFAAQ
jgi:TonB family protein